MATDMTKQVSIWRVSLNASPDGTSRLSSVLRIISLSFAITEDSPSYLQMKWIKKFYYRKSRRYFFLLPIATTMFHSWWLGSHRFLCHKQQCPIDNLCWQTASFCLLCGFQFGVMRASCSNRRGFPPLGCNLVCKADSPEWFPE